MEINPPQYVEPIYVIPPEMHSPNFNQVEAYNEGLPSTYNDNYVSINNQIVPRASQPSALRSYPRDPMRFRTQFSQKIDVPTNVTVEYDKSFETIELYNSALTQLVTEWKPDLQSESKAAPRLLNPKILDQYFTPQGLGINQSSLVSFKECWRHILTNSYGPIYYDTFASASLLVYTQSEEAQALSSMLSRRDLGSQDRFCEDIFINVISNGKNGVNVDFGAQPNNYTNLVFDGSFCSKQKIEDIINASRYKHVRKFFIITPEELKTDIEYVASQTSNTESLNHPPDDGDEYSQLQTPKPEYPPSFDELHDEDEGDHDAQLDLNASQSQPQFDSEELHSGQKPTQGDIGPIKEPLTEAEKEKILEQLGPALMSRISEPEQYDDIQKILGEMIEYEVLGTFNESLETADIHHILTQTKPEYAHILARDVLMGVPKTRIESTIYEYYNREDPLVFIRDFTAHPEFKEYFIKGVNPTLADKVMKFIFEGSPQDENNRKDYRTFSEEEVFRDAVNRIRDGDHELYKAYMDKLTGGESQSSDAKPVFYKVFKYKVPAYVDFVGSTDFAKAGDDGYDGYCVLKDGVFKVSANPATYLKSKAKSFKKITDKNNLYVIYTKEGNDWLSHDKYPYKITVSDGSLQSETKDPTYRDKAEQFDTDARDPSKLRIYRISDIETSKPNVGANRYVVESQENRMPPNYKSPSIFERAAEIAINALTPKKPSKPQGEESERESLLHSAQTQHGDTGKGFSAGAYKDIIKITKLIPISTVNGISCHLYEIAIR